MRSSSKINLMGEYIVDKTRSLGKGATGEVFMGTDLRSQANVAIKIIDLTTIDNEVTKYLLEMEKRALIEVSNPYVLKGLKVIQNYHYCYLITEHCDGGTLKDYIKAEGHLSEVEALRIILEVIKGECGLISKGIIHRDLKPANILFHGKQIKIIDFGYCQIIDSTKPNIDYNVGSPSYMAPEAFLDNEYSEKTEVWAIGVTLYYCLNGCTFDEGMNMADVFKNLKKFGLPYRTSVSYFMKKIVGMCLYFNPLRRPTCSYLLNIITYASRALRPSITSLKVFSQLDLNYENERKLRTTHEIDLRTKLNIYNQPIVKPYHLFLRTITSEFNRNPIQETSNGVAQSPLYLQSRETNKYIYKHRYVHTKRLSVANNVQMRFTTYAKYNPTQVGGFRYRLTARPSVQHIPLNYERCYYPPQNNIFAGLCYTPYSQR